MLIRQTFTKTKKHLKKVMTIQNIGLVVVLLVTISWTWNSAMILEQNYKYQRQVDANEQQIEIIKISNQNLKYKQEYFKSDEFLELKAREKLNKAKPGEHLVILPELTDEQKKPKTYSVYQAESLEFKSNFSKWMDFLFGERKF